MPTNSQLSQENSKLRRENAQLKKQNKTLKEEAFEIQKENARMKQGRDPSPPKKQEPEALADEVVLLRRALVKAMVAAHNTLMHVGTDLEDECLALLGVESPHDAYMYREAWQRLNRQMQTEKATNATEESLSA